MVIKEGILYVVRERLPEARTGVAGGSRSSGGQTRSLECELVARVGSQTTGAYCIIKELNKILRSRDNDDGFGSQ